MQRLIDARLEAWKGLIGRMPLLIRGAKQVGKSYVVEAFGRKHFSHTLTINFKKRPEYKCAFDALSAGKICDKLSLQSKQVIEPGKTLLFLDEIQECPQAIMALRYFKEEIPELHVIGVGSLLELICKDEAFRMLVGKVQFIHVKPLSFKEFLLATGNQVLLERCAQMSPEEKIDSVMHDDALELLRKYLVIGGAPAVVQHYLDTENLTACQELQADLLMSYRSDFGKYTSRAEYKYVQAIFERLPSLVGQPFKYSAIDPRLQSRDLRKGLAILRDMGLLYQVFSVNANGLPLMASLNPKKFKLLFLDVGLVQYATHLGAELLLKKDLFTVNLGSIVEQFVGQELLTLSKVFESGELYCWERKAIGSTAEVDYIINVGAQIVPIEVKATATGWLKSLRIFMNEKQSLLGVNISQRPLEFVNGILSIPLYMIHELPRLVQIL